MRRKLRIILLVVCVTLICFPVSSLAETKTIVTVKSVDALPGSTVDVDVDISGNLGILSAILEVSFSDSLTLLDIKSGDAFRFMNFTPPGRMESPCRVMWDALEAPTESAGDGTIMTLTFQVSEAVSEGDRLDIELSAVENGVYDGSLSPVELETVGGSVIISLPDTVISSASGVIEENRGVVTLYSFQSNWNAVVIAAGFDAAGVMQSANVQRTILNAGENTVAFENLNVSLSYQAFILDDQLCPYCGKVELKKPDEADEFPIDVSQSQESASLSGGEPTIRVESASAFPGREAVVRIHIDNNPGVLSLTLNVEYGDELTLKEAVSGEAFRALSMTPPGKFASPCNFMWDAIELSDGDALDGNILTLTFETPSDAGENAVFPITISCNPDNAYDRDMNPVSFALVSGAVNVQSVLPGDANGDEKVNNLDVIVMRRALVGGYGVSVNPSAADVNADRKFNNLDVIIMRRYLVGGYGIDSLPYGSQVPPQKCEHSLTAVAYKAPTEAEEGNIAHWICSKCGKYFSDAAGTAEISQKDTILSRVSPSLNKTHSVSYNIPNGDPYLKKLADAGEIENPNPAQFDEESGLVLSPLDAEGYRFLGWHNLPAGDGARLMETIPPKTANNVALYAHWEKIHYKVQYKSDLFLEKSEDTFTVDTGVVLPTPAYSNYIFTGWTDEEGKLYESDKIPEGVTRNVTLKANWTSLRNRARSKTRLEAPVVIEDEAHQRILFSYEIGAIENVPVAVIHDYGFIAEGGVGKSGSVTYSSTVSEALMSSHVQSVAKATTQSANWTLSNGWTESMDINEQSAMERGYTKEEAEKIAKSDTNTWNVSSGRSGTTATTHLESNSSEWADNVKVGYHNEHNTGEHETTTRSFHIDGNITYTPKSYTLGVGAGYGIGASDGENSVGAGAGVNGSLKSEGGLGGGITAGYSKTRQNDTWDTTQTSFDVGFTKGRSGSSLTTDTAYSSASWNSSSSYGGSRQIASSQEISEVVSSKDSRISSYGKSYISSGNQSQTQGLVSGQTDTDEYSNAVTFSKIEQKEVTLSWETTNTRAGWHRWIYVNTAHVFAIVAYDIEARSYSVYTYSVMEDDAPQEFEDYSAATSGSGAYNDRENSVIPFEIPYEVAEYVAERTAASEGLEVNQETGVITSYSGADDCVVIPEYFHANNKVVKVTGIKSDAFCGNVNIVGAVLSDFITEIPEGAFSGCSALRSVQGRGVKKIGANAFSGCTSMLDAAISPQIETLGANAFTGVDGLLATPGNENVAKNAAQSGARQIALFLNHMKDGTLDGESLSVPNSAAYFEVFGADKTVTGAALDSHAGKTVLNRIHFVGNGKIPLQIHSAEAVLNEVSAKAPGLAMVFSSENVRLGLQGLITAESENGKAFLCKNLTLYKSNPKVTGELSIRKKLFVCGDVDDNGLMTFEEYSKINADAFERMLHSYTIFFDANGGICEETSRSVEIGAPVGALPNATRTDYTLSGWHTAPDGGDRVTETTTFADGDDHTLYAHWALNVFTLSFDANGGICEEASRAVGVNQSVGLLPTPVKDYHSFAGWFLNDGTKVEESTVFNSAMNRTLTARWSENPVSGWVSESNVPYGAQLVKEKWTYDEKSTRESTETSMPGYSREGDGRWVVSGNGSSNYASFPSAFDAGHWIYTNFAKEPYSAYENETNKREVRNDWTGYVYWHWMYNVAYANTTVRAISGYKGTFMGWWYGYFYAFTSGVDCPYLDNYYCNSQNLPSYYCHDVLPETGSVGIGTPRFLRFDYYTSSYTDSYRVFTYSRVDRRESETPVAPGGGISNVERWVQYRAK